MISRLKIKDEKIFNRLLILLNHEEELIRRISAILLTELGTAEALNVVVAGSKHGHAIRTEAAWKLKAMGKKASAAIPGLRFHDFWKWSLTLKLQKPAERKR